MHSAKISRKFLFSLPPMGNPGVPFGPCKNPDLCKEENKLILVLLAMDLHFEETFKFQCSFPCIQVIKRYGVTRDQFFPDPKCTTHTTPAPISRPKMAAFWIICGKMSSFQIKVNNNNSDSLTVDWEATAAAKINRKTTIKTNSPITNFKILITTTTPTDDVGAKNCW